MKDWQEFTSDDWKHLYNGLLDYSSRVFAAIILLNPSTETVSSGGKSALDFVSETILDFLSGTLVWQPEKGSLLNFLKIALRADIIDHLRSHYNQTQGMEDLVDPGQLIAGKGISDSDTGAMMERIRHIVRDDIALGNFVDLILETEVTKPRELALRMGVPVREIYNLRRRLVRKILKFPLR